MGKIKVLTNHFYLQTKDGSSPSDGIIQLSTNLPGDPTLIELTYGGQSNELRELIRGLEAIEDELIRGIKF